MIGQRHSARHSACRVLTVILLLFVALATWYSITVPLGEAPDELPHFTYMRYIAQHGRLPTTAEEHEAFQPPLYYAAGALLTFCIEDEPEAPFAQRANAHYDVLDPESPKNLLLHTSAERWPYRGWALAWHLIRLWSVALGAVTVWAIYQLGRVLFASRPEIGLAMAGLAAFTPQFLFLSGVINNDNAATALSALVLWQVAVLVHEPVPNWRRSAFLGLLLGLGMLSKASLMALAPVVAVAILLATAAGRWSLSTGEQLAVVVDDVRPGQAARRMGRLRHLALGDVQRPPTRVERLFVAAWYLLLAFGTTVLVAGWYFVRNLLLHGDPLGWSFVLQTNAVREGGLTLDVLLWLFRGLFRSFWLGWIGIEFDGWIYWIIGVVCLVGAVSFVAWLLRRWWHLDWPTRWTLCLLGLHVVLTIGSLIQWTATVLGTDQGRLIYPILPLVMLVLALGWSWWAADRAHRPLLVALVAGMFLLAVVTPGRYIAPVHAPAPRASQAALETAAPVNVDWDGIRLLRYHLPTDQVAAGSRLSLDLYWQATEPVGRDLMAYIKLVDENGHFIMYVDGSPTAGRDTTDRWQPGVPLAAHHRLAVPAGTPPGVYRITIGVHPFGDPVWLMAVDESGQVVGDHIVLPETIEVASQE
ncbi:MAG: glycosyltransferase family 39 protein [Anaerolineae bacterium]|nr:glycosyltransferase family 39 protein [Anaerolineae bacterium]